MAQAMSMFQCCKGICRHLSIFFRKKQAVGLEL
uniref:Tegument protein n=1 Tax=Siphoviridae sp. ctdYc1 TaxID=2826399 RepID=A0A8S5N0E6_9CAUD|nr:MAG TPA: tegument protein [Siphoviridae sp. ctdYc1]